MNIKKKSNGRKNKNKNKLKKVSGGSSRNIGNNNVSGFYQNPTPILTFNRDSPGRVRVKTTTGLIVQAPGVSGSQTISYTGFNSWCGQARAILTPFQWFRVVELTVTCFMYGGAASTYTCGFNATNSAYTADLTISQVMDDDYSAFATGVNQPLISLPRSYLLDGSRKWYNATDGSGGVPSTQDLTQGVMYFVAAGAVATTEVGLAVTEMVIEFHTLV